jgi:hypothetical protein
MYLIREVIHCRPGGVRRMLEKFKALAGPMQQLGQKPFRLLTDVTGERFWTLIAETEVERLDDFLALEGRLMADEAARTIMDGHHDLIEHGRREIYRIES